MTKILYVEDEPFLAKIVKETLEGKGYDITHVSDGGEVVPTYKNQDFDICILDVMLPNKNGFEIAKELRNLSKEVPILFLTAKDQTEDLVRGFKAGGNDYIRKPFSIEELIVRIENMLALTYQKGIQKVDHKTIQIGQSFIFHPYKLELVHPEKQLKLSHRESQILELLCLAHDHTVERKAILMKVWGDDSFYNSRNLDVYITKLRAYFKLDPKVKIITLKGVGYQFIMDE